MILGSRRFRWRRAVVCDGARVQVVSLLCLLSVLLNLSVLLESEVLIVEVASHYIVDTMLMLARHTYYCASLVKVNEVKCLLGADTA